MSTKSNKINWSNNQKRQQEVADSGQALLLAAYAIVMAILLLVNAGQDVLIACSVIALALSTTIIAMLGAAQLAFAVAPRIAAYRASKKSSALRNVLSFV